MEEEILKIMGNNLTITDYMAGIDGVPETAKEITSHVMEFIEWLQLGLHSFGRIEHIEELLYVNFKEGSEHKYTLDQVYQYWLTNIKNDGL